MEAATSPVESVICFLARTEKCRQVYLPVIARGAAWALAVLLAASLSSPAMAGGKWHLGAVAAAIAVLGYFIVIGLLLPGGEEERKPGFVKKAILLAAIAVLVAAERLSHLPDIGDKILLMLLSVPTARRLARVAPRLGLAASLASAGMLAAALALLALRDSPQAYVDLLAAAEITLVTAATRRMIMCSEEAVAQLLDGNADGELMSSQISS